jgi:hypothetical protein
VFLPIAALTLALGLTPLVVYAHGRLTGALPAPEEWWSHGGNHGPWWGEPMEIVLLASWLGLFLLPFVTAPAGLWCARSVQPEKPLTAGLLLWAAQWGLLLLQVMTLVWTVD